MERGAPETEEARTLQAKVGERRWSLISSDARRKAALVEAVIEAHATGEHGWMEALRQAAPDVPWSTFVNWRRRYQTRSGPAWERLLDARVPPTPARIAEEVRSAARALRVADPHINTEKAQEGLKALFGEAFTISAASLRRLWSESGLGFAGRGQAGTGVRETVEEYHGGGGLALLLAADIETGATGRLAAAAQAAGAETAAAQQEVVPAAAEEVAGGRDDHGRLTALYNRQWQNERGEGELDGRYAPDATKRMRRTLETLPTLGMRSSTLRHRLLAMGVIPLLTERRGFAGLEGPAGAWLGVLGGHAYMPATLSKGLAELGLLDVNHALWDTHATTWAGVVQRWTADGAKWLQLVAYVDATQEPYWARRFAKSGKVSRTGKVMPCLTEVAITAGPGVPLLSETWTGTVSLSRELVRLIQRLDDALGRGEVGRLLVMDAEMGTKRLLAALRFQLRRPFITVIKGMTLRGAKIEPVGEWVGYRTRDEVRELHVAFSGAGAVGEEVPEAGFVLRGVEMRRQGSRAPRTTVMVTDVREDELPTTAVVDAYLSRWPHQEGVFRNRRNGGGLNRSYGYSGEMIQYVALETKLEQAKRRVQRSERDLAAATNELTVLERPSQQGGSHCPASPRELVSAAKNRVRALERSHTQANAQLHRLQTMPRQIFARDTGRDNIMTCLKLNVLMLASFVLREYFGGLKMELRTFIEALVTLPVTVRTSSTRVRYQLHANPRKPQLTARLRDACDTINHRRLKTGKQRIFYEVIPPPEIRP